MSATARFLRDREFIVKKGQQDVTVSHTTMDGGCGGRFHIPAGEPLEAFYAAYGEDLSHARDLFFIEINTPIFMLHFDIDFKELLEETRVLEFCDVVNAAVAEYFQRPRVCIVCAVLDEHRRERSGPGLHLIFPNTPVSADMALAIWAGVVACCEQLLDWGGEQWPVIIDVGVLKTKGSLRMVGSKKSIKCPNPQCSGKRGQAYSDCTQCFGKLNIAVDKVYWPWRVIASDKALAERKLVDLTSNQAHAVKACSVRTDLPSPSDDFAAPRGAPLPGKLQSKQRSATASIIRQELGRIPRSSQTSPLSLQPDALAALTVAIRGYDASYAALTVNGSAIVKVGSGDAARCWIKVRGKNDRYCLNKGDCHGSSQIYFGLSFRGIEQKCFSTKALARGPLQCLCKSFSGPARPVSELVMRACGFMDAPEERAAEGAPPAAEADTAEASGAAAASSKRRRADCAGARVPKVPKVPGASACGGHGGGGELALECYQVILPDTLM